MTGVTASTAQDDSHAPNYSFRHYRREPEATERLPRLLIRTREKSITQFTTVGAFAPCFNPALSRKSLATR